VAHQPAKAFQSPSNISSTAPVGAHLTFAKKMKILLMRTLLLIAAFGQISCDRLHNGQSSAYESPVPDGCIVLVREGSRRGAFILTNQHTTPETTDVHWYARTDAGGSFVPPDPSIATGKSVGVAKVSFPGFTVDWSIAEDGKGWVYFSVLPTDTKSAPQYEMCVTDETDIARIDANDPKWIYRERPSVNHSALPKP